MTRRLALRWALMGFVLTIIRGMYLSVGFDATLHAALMSLAVMYSLGWMSDILWNRAFGQARRKLPTAN